MEIFRQCKLVIEITNRLEGLNYDHSIVELRL